MVEDEEEDRKVFDHLQEQIQQGLEKIQEMERCMYLLFTALASTRNVMISRTKLDGPPAISTYDQYIIYYNVPSRRAWIRSGGALVPLFTFSPEAVNDAPK